MNGGFTLGFISRFQDATKGRKGKGRKAKRVEEAEERQCEEFQDREEYREDRNEDEGEGDEEAESAKYELFDKIVAFFEDRPYFYDVGDKNYCNKKRKDAKLADFAGSLNWARKYL